MLRTQKTRWILMLLSLFAIVVGYNKYNKEHVDFTIVEVVADFEATELSEFVSSLNLEERGAIGNNVYSVEGVVAKTTSEGFTLKGGVFCQTENTSLLTSKEGDSVKIRGRFVGYDDIFQEVRLDHVVPF